MHENQAVTSASTMTTSAEQIMQAHGEHSMRPEAAAQIMQCANVTVSKYMTRGFLLRSGERLILGSYKLNGKRWIPMEALKEFIERQLADSQSR